MARVNDVSIASSTDLELSPSLRRMVMSGLGLAGAGANVIMQLSRLPVGHAIAESNVESGSLSRHPIKRTRTTLGYVMIALFGSEYERAALRNEVNRQHRTVISSSDSSIPYNAFDPELQLWVAACMYRGLEDALTVLYGPLSSETLNVLYQRSSRFATTLQVPPSSWPADREAFDDYWSESLELVAMDDVTRAYLYGIASLDFLPRPASFVLGPLHRLITTGFLPQLFRDELGLPWNTWRRSVFRVITATIASANRHLPAPIREFPWNLSLRSARHRIRSGRPFV